MTSTDTSTAIVREIDIKAPAAKVYAALTDPDQLPQWWGDPATYHVTKMESDPRVGGEWLSTGVNAVDGTPFGVGGVYRELDPPRLIEMTWKHDWGKVADQVETVVRYELDEHDGITHVTVRHWGFVTAESKDAHDKGWTVVLGWLRGYLE